MTAAAGRLPREAVDGVLLLDKPAGITSQTAVSRVKALYNAAKAGHTGTLDPMATGLLPIALGEATKFSSMLLDADKGYLATVRLGVTTTTGDLEGEETGRSPVAVDERGIEDALARFRGPISQTPPMYSALKHQGRPLYAYAREGREIERTARPVTIASLVLDGYSPPDATISVTCSKGTYIRVLAEDIGRALGCGATLAALRRTRVGGFSVSDAIGLETLRQLPAAERTAWLHATDAMLRELPAIELEPEQAVRIGRGQTLVSAAFHTPGLARLVSTGGVFLGVGKAADDGVLRAHRLVAQKPAKA